MASRLFVALDVPDTLRPLLAALRSEEMPARWTAPEQYHLTLRFLGDVPDEQVPSVQAALSAIEASSFRLQPTRLGVFPSRRRPRVLFVGFATSEPLQQLHQQVEQAVGRFGPAAHRPFRPHLTLARFREASPETVHAYLRRHHALAFPSFHAEAFHLYESRLRLSGAEHHRLATFALR